MFPSSTKREIRHFHVVVVRRRQRNLQKSVIQVQSCYFVNLNLLVFCLPRCRRRPPCLSSLTTGTARATAAATATRTSNKQNYNSTPASRCLVHFFAVIARQRREIPSRDGLEFVEDRNTRRQIFLSLSKLKIARARFLKNSFSEKFTFICAFAVVVAKALLVCVERRFFSAD